MNFISRLRQWFSNLLNLTRIAARLNNLEAAHEALLNGLQNGLLTAYDTLAENIGAADQKIDSVRDEFRAAHANAMTAQDAKHNQASQQFEASAQAIELQLKANKVALEKYFTELLDRVVVTNGERRFVGPATCDGCGLSVARFRVDEGIVRCANCDPFVVRHELQEK